MMTPARATTTKVNKNLGGKLGVTGILQAFTAGPHNLCTRTEHDLFLAELLLTGAPGVP